MSHLLRSRQLQGVFRPLTRRSGTLPLDPPIISSRSAFAMNSLRPLDPLSESATVLKTTKRALKTSMFVLCFFFQFEVVYEMYCD